MIKSSRQKQILILILILLGFNHISYNSNAPVRLSLFLPTEPPSSRADDRESRYVSLADTFNSVMILATSGVVAFSPLLHIDNPQRRPSHRLGLSKAVRACCNGSGEAARSSGGTNRRCECFDVYKELVPYKKGWSWQKSLVRWRHTLIDRDEDHADMLIILQHPPVYTLGTGSLEEYLNFDIKNAPHDIYRTERGGEVTYHGPGQLIMYPIVNLRYHKMDLHWYLRSLEEVVIRALLTTFSIKASRLEGFTGVWVGNQKVAAIGIRVSRWIAYHGLALNVTTDLTPFQHIVPCGIRDRQVGSLSGLLGQSCNGRIADDKILMDVTHDAFLKEFSEVFQLSLEHKSISDLDLLEEKSCSLLLGK